MATQMPQFEVGQTVYCFPAQEMEMQINDRTRYPARVVEIHPSTYLIEWEPTGAPWHLKGETLVTGRQISDSPEL